MSDLLYRLLNEAPDGVTVKDMGTADDDKRVVQWWACDRYGISLRTGEGYHWAEAQEIVKDSSRSGFSLMGTPRDLEGMDWIRRFLGEVISEYRSNVRI